jgi:Exostosin family
VSRIHLLSASQPGDRYWDERAHWDLNAMRQAASTDRFKSHSLVESPEEADLILFVETSTCAGPYFESIRRHDTFQEHRRKSYVYCATDVILPLVPGVFPSISRHDFLEAWSRSGGYIGIHESEALTFDPESRPSRLFSFVGSSATHRVRKRVMHLNHPAGLLIDTSKEPAEALSRAQYERRYRDALLDSAFILCPRGGSPSTFRLMEAMIMGRVPVIISDEWCPPTGPDWGSFSIRVAESDVDDIPRLLETNWPKAQELGLNARRAWLDWFGPETAFHRTVEWTLELHARSAEREGRGRATPWWNAARPFHLLRRGKHRFSRRGNAE